ncbi:MAG: hypothetical protein KGI90_17600 [Burkholderiales bacterium]|nr:hypothetical protein [Burkholderiales bacterium]
MLPVKRKEAKKQGMLVGSRTLVVLEALPPELRAELLDKGWAVIDMSAPEQWEALFQQHAHVFH